MRSPPTGLRHEDVSELSATRRGAASHPRPRSWPTSRAAAGRLVLPAAAGRPFAGGTISPTRSICCIEAGYLYLGNGLADDIPHYWVSDFASRRALLTLPYYYHFDDQFFLMFPRKGTGLEHPDALLRNWRGEFEHNTGAAAIST